MVLSKESINALRESIEGGSFPASEELLTSDLSSKDFPAVLNAISEAREDLGREIRKISKNHASDVDDWITQAKKLQQDIAHCKVEAKIIVEEHERAEAIRKLAQDNQNKVRFLEEEIAFNQALQHELEAVEEISRVLDEAGTRLAQQQPVAAVETLVSASTSIGRVSATQTQVLLKSIEDDLRQRCGTQLLQNIDAAWEVVHEQDRTSLSIGLSSTSRQSSAESTSIQRNLDALALLDILADGAALILKRLERSLLPLFTSKSKTFPQSVVFGKDQIQIMLGSSRPPILTLLKTFNIIVENLHLLLPKSVQSTVATQLSPKLVVHLINDWLNQAIPHELEGLKAIGPLKSGVAETASLLESYSWPGHQELEDWIDQIPKTWLSKRRVTTLDGVRKAYRTAQGTPRQVERVERQVVSEQLPNVPEENPEDDWNANWDMDPGEDMEQVQKRQETEEEGTDGWDFDTESNHSDAQSEPESADKKHEDEDESGEAWGWDDETPALEKKTHATTPKPAKDVAQHTASKEIILKELYTITDVPDYVLEIIGKDISDSQLLSSAQDDFFFTTSAPVAAMQALPNLTLAMFRATAPTYYSHNRNLSSMNLYNDALYISQKINETITAQMKTQMTAALETMNKFARQTYTRELDIQRTVLSDLLDGAQGFVSCNSDQYRDLSASAVSSVVDRIRQLHQEYQPILSPSHLCQTIGLLVTMVIGKVIQDIEDLEDISEKESERLVEYCQRISGLEDLFEATAPDTGNSVSEVRDESPEEPQKLSTIALYVPNHFRFLYLAEILKSSLADIRFMWTEGGLNMEFSADEIIDLIKALFAESSHRKSAINAIRK